MASISIGAIRPYRKVRVAHFPEAASQTFNIGDAVMLGSSANTGHRVMVAVDDNTRILGFAAEDASGTTDTKIAVWVADALGEFVGNICTGAIADAAIDYDLIGTNAGLSPDTTNAVWRVDTGDTAANQVVHITELLSAAADTNGRVVFRVLDVANTAAAHLF